jgi:hypothetical protein
VKNWLDTSNKRCSRKPVKEGTIFKSLWMILTLSYRKFFY